MADASLSAIDDRKYPDDTMWEDTTDHLIITLGSDTAGEAFGDDETVIGTAWLDDGYIYPYTP